MRMRYKPYARPELAAWPNFIDSPQKMRGQWASSFANPSFPLRIELGCGKGGFLAGVSLREPQYNYLGIDIKSEVLVVAKRTIEQSFLSQERPIFNAAITSWNIEKIPSILSPQDHVERIYINFCNPWYKSGHAKHRLTHPRQLVSYRDFLADGCEIFFKTDDDYLFNDSLRYFEYTGFSLQQIWRNLHAEEPSWNIRTEHEQMFAAQGIPIKACIAKKQPATLDREAISRLKNL